MTKIEVFKKKLKLNKLEGKQVNYKKIISIYKNITKNEKNI